MDRHQQPAVSLTATPKGMAGTPSSSRVSKKGGGQLRSYLLGEQTPKKKREKAERREYVQYTIDCISQGNLEELNGILEGGAVDVNAVDDDGHTLLDLAVILNQFACAHLLQLFGGAETEAYVESSLATGRAEPTVPLPPTRPPRGPCFSVATRLPPRGPAPQPADCPSP